MVAGENFALLQSFGEENIGEFKLLTISSSEFGIWLSNILVNDVRFAKVFPATILRYTVFGILTIK